MSKLCASILRLAVVTSFAGATALAVEGCASPSDEVMGASDEAALIAAEDQLPRTRMGDEKMFADSEGPVVPPGASSIHLQYYGGRVLANVKVVAVSWGPNVSPEVQNGVSDFYRTITDSAYFDWLSEYNTPTQSIGRGSFVGQFTIAPGHASASLTNADVAAELVAQLDAGVLPPPEADSLYMFNFPPGVRIRLGSAESCSAFGFCGYHNTVSYQGKQVAYGVVPDFSAASGQCESGCGGTGSMFEKQTSVLSHELIEAVTDPDVQVSTAWIQRGRGEIGDVCHYRTHLLGYNVQLQWSNAAGACISTR